MRGFSLVASRRARLVCLRSARWALAAFGLAALPAQAAEKLTNPVTQGLTLPKGHGEVALGYANAHGDFAFNLDGSKIEDRALVPFQAYRDQSALLVARYGLTRRWTFGLRIPYTWRAFTIDRSPLVDTEGRLIVDYPASRTHGLGDARFDVTYAIGERWGVNAEWKSSSGADNFFPTKVPGARPAVYIGSGQSNFTVSLLGSTRAGPARFTGALAYRRRMTGISNYLLRDFKPADEAVADGMAWLETSRVTGLGLGADYLHQASATSVSALHGRFAGWWDFGPWQLRGQYRAPLYGKDYPALFPEQLAEPQPLLGSSFEVLLAWRWR